MPIDVEYSYQIETVDAKGNRAKVDCGPYALKAYDFSAVTQSALCYAAPGLVLKYTKSALGPDGRPTGVVEEADYIVGGRGEWMTLGVGKISPA